MATKQNTAITIDREAISDCAAAGEQAVKEMEPEVEALDKSIAYLTNPDNLDGAEAKEFREGLISLSNIVNVAFHRLQKLAQALKKMNDRYGAMKTTTVTSLDQAKQEFAALKMKADAANTKK